MAKVVTIVRSVSMPTYLAPSGIGIEDGVIDRLTRVLVREIEPEKHQRRHHEDDDVAGDDGDRADRDRLVDQIFEGSVCIW